MNNQNKELQSSVKTETIEKCLAEQQEQFVRERRKKRIRNGIIAILILIIILLLFVRCGGGEIPPSPSVSNEGINMGIDPNAQDGYRETSGTTVDDLNELANRGNITIEMNAAPYFENGTSKGNLLIYNNEINHYPQIVEIYRTDTDECIYASGLIPVGSRIDEAKLDIDLDAGTYQCVAYFTAVSEDGQRSGTAGANITITVAG